MTDYRGNLGEHKYGLHVFSNLLIFHYICMSLCLQAGLLMMVISLNVVGKYL